MKKFIVRLDGFRDLNDFVLKVSGVNSYVDASLGHIVVDAKSIQGMVYICAQAEPITLTLYSEDYDEIDSFEELIKGYEV